MHKKLETFLNVKGIQFTQNQELAKFTTFQIGGEADFIVSPVNRVETQAIQQYLFTEKIGAFYLSGGSNVLFSDDGFRGVVVRADYPAKIEFHETEGRTEMSTPASIKSSLFSKKISQKGIEGFEFLSTIPGELAGAIVQNAGCYGSEIKDCLVNVTVSDNNRLYTLTNEELNFKYRSSIFKYKKDLFIHSAVFQGKKGIKETINNKIEQYKQNRLSSQPRNRKCAGSIFTNPPNQKAWQLIADSGLQGQTFGDAQVSMDHANFIVNLGSATAKDVLSLIELIKVKVREKTGIVLKEEIVIVDPNPL